MKHTVRAIISFIIMMIMLLSNTAVLANSLITPEVEQEIVEEKETEGQEEKKDQEETKQEIEQEGQEKETEEKTEEEDKEEQEETTPVKTPLPEEPQEEKNEEENIEMMARTTEIGKQTLPDGVYAIHSAINSKFVFDVNGASKDNGANVHLYENSVDGQKRFRLTYLGNGYYSIIITHSNKALDVKDASTQKGANVWQWEQNGKDSQQWMIKEAGNGYYSIVSKCNGLYVDVENAIAGNYTNIQMCDGNGLLAQKFIFEKVRDKNDVPIQGTKTLDDGTYIIRSAINPIFAFDVYGALNTNGANVQLYEYTIDKQKKFKVTYLGDGCYSLVAMHSNKSLAVKDASYEKGANVYQWEQDGSDSQKWIIKEAGNGYYSIISKLSGFYIDVNNGIANNYTNLQMCNGNGMAAQKFRFDRVKENSEIQVQGTKTLDDGTYIIRSSINQKYAFDINGASNANGANLQLYEFAPANQKRFKVTYLGDGFYTIVAVHSNKALEVKDAATEKGANVWQWEQTGEDNQKWVLKEVGNGYYSIISKCNGLYIDVNNGTASNFTNIQMCDGNGLSAQKFNFEKITDRDGKETIEEGTYVIRSGLNQRYALDVNGASIYNGTNVQLYEYAEVPQKRFKVTYLGDGYYSIVASHSNKSLDVKDASTQKGANVWQWEQNGTDAQKWRIVDAGNGYYNIISKCNGLYMDVLDANASNFTNIQMCDGNGGMAQKFVFTTQNQWDGIDVSYANGNITWASVKNSGQVEFAMIRVGYRGYGYDTPNITMDSQFLKNIMGTKANNIDIGLYFMSQAVNVAEAVEEANYVLDMVRKYNIKVTYPIAIDSEYSGAPGNTGRADGLDVVTRTAVCKAFVDTIENAGYKGAVYASRNWFYEKLDVSQLTRGDIWVAHYTSAARTDYRYSYQMWQYTSSGWIPGINGNVDRNICYKKY